jgi:hypothetical protein
MTSTASGAGMDDNKPLIRTLECECSNRGVAVYTVAGTNRTLADLVGDFRRGEGNDPPIYCDFCDTIVSA